MKKNTCEVCGCVVTSVSELHRLKRTTPTSWNGSIYIETCSGCSILLDEMRPSFIQGLRESFSKRRKAEKRKVVRKNARSNDVPKGRVQVQKTLPTVHGRANSQ